jgi:hypothetical protein
LNLFSPIRDSRQIIHFRLGDLLTIDKERIVSEQIFETIREFSVKDWSVLTDSPLEAEAQLKSNDFGLNFESFYKLAPKEVLRAGFKSDIFVGTTSKLSIWIVIFRLRFNRGKSFLPMSMKESVSRLLAESEKGLLHFY